MIKKMMHSFLTKQKLICSLRTVNVLLILLLGSMIYENVKQYNHIQTTQEYVDRYANSHYQIAESDMKNVFDKFIIDSELTIENKNAVYEEFRGLEDVIKGEYDLTLSGTYLKLLSYLENMYNNKMLHKINNFSLIVQSTDSIKINLSLESLYESE